MGGVFNSISISQKLLRGALFCKVKTLQWNNNQKRPISFHLEKLPFLELGSAVLSSAGDAKLVGKGWDLYI